MQREGQAAPKRARPVCPLQNLFFGGLLLEGGSWVCLSTKVSMWLPVHHLCGQKGTKTNSRIPAVRGLGERRAVQDTSRLCACTETLGDLSLNLRHTLTPSNPPPHPFPEKEASRQAQGEMNQQGPLCALHPLPLGGRGRSMPSSGFWEEGEG